MRGFYQSETWKLISAYIFDKPIFECELFGKKYWGTVKTAKKWLITLAWYQVLGVKFPDIEKKKFYINEELDRVKRDIKHGMTDIFLQIWITNHIRVSENTWKNRKELEKRILSNCSLKTSFRENMPLATIVIDLNQDLEILWKKINKSGRRHIRRWEKYNLVFKSAEWDEIKQFYDLWNRTSNFKWFNIWPEKEYNRLIKFIKKEKRGDLFLVKKGKDIVSGSIMLYDKDEAYYLYGATNRDLWNLWWHYFLKWEINKYLKEKNFKLIDLLWVAPKGYKNHHLWWVSQFKEALGGKHIEYWGNYDLVFNKMLYQTFKMIRK